MSNSGRKPYYIRAKWKTVECLRQVENHRITEPSRKRWHFFREAQSFLEYRFEIITSPRSLRHRPPQFPFPFPNRLGYEFAWPLVGNRKPYTRPVIPWPKYNFPAFHVIDHSDGSVARFSTSLFTPILVPAATPLFPRLFQSLARLPFPSSSFFYPLLRSPLSPEVHPLFSRLCLPSWTLSHPFVPLIHSESLDCFPFLFTSPRFSSFLVVSMHGRSVSQKQRLQEFRGDSSDRLRSNRILTGVQVPPRVDTATSRRASRDFIIYVANGTTEMGSSQPAAPFPPSNPSSCRFHPRVAWIAETTSIRETGPPRARMTSSPTPNPRIDRGNLERKLLERTEAFGSFYTAVT